MSKDVRMFIELLHHAENDGAVKADSVDFLADIQSDFTVPNDYFEHIDDSVMRMIQADDKKEDMVDTPRVSSMTRVLLAVASTAASLALILSLGFYFYNTQREIDAQVEAIVAYDAAEDVLIDLVDGQNLEDILAEAAYELD